MYDHDCNSDYLSDICHMRSLYWGARKKGGREEREERATQRAGESAVYGSNGCNDEACRRVG